VGVSGQKGNGNSSSNFVPWFAGLLSLLAAVATVLGMFVKITPIEIETGGGFVAVGLFVVCAACAGAAVWSHRPRTTTSTTTQGGPGLDSEPETGGPGRTAGGQDGSPNTARSTATGGNPTQPDGGPAPANDAVRYQAVSGSPGSAQCVWS
jgi:hypothetical protein